MSHNLRFNPYTMTGKTAYDEDCIIAWMSENENDDLIIRPDGSVYTMSGEFIAYGKIVGVGNGVVC